jgi:prepilin-type N-terminal cleavage/methylation domain-containing protein
MTINLQIRANSKAGFSLIEMVIYIAILALMLSVIVSVIYSLTQSNRQIRTTRLIENSAMIVLERIEREIREAETLIEGSSVFDVHPSSLTLSGEAQGGGLETTEIDFANGRIYLHQGGVDLGAISDPDVTVDSLIFRHFESGEVEGVRVELTFSAGTSTHLRTENFYSSILLR